MAGTTTLIDDMHTHARDSFDAFLAWVNEDAPSFIPNPKGPFARVFEGPSETIPALGVCADRGADGRVTLRAEHRQTARQRARTQRTIRALRLAQTSFTERFDSYLPGGNDLSKVDDVFVDVMCRAINGDVEARQLLTEHLGIEIDGILSLIRLLNSDARNIQEAVAAAITTILTLAEQVPDNPQEPPDLPKRHIHLADISTSVAPVHGPTATTTTSQTPGRVVVTAA